MVPIISINSLACGVVSGDDEVKGVSKCSIEEKDIGDKKSTDLTGQAIGQVIHVELEAMLRDVRSWRQENICLCFIAGGE